jgi:hypothetical protein
VHAATEEAAEEAARAVQAAINIGTPPAPQDLILERIIRWGISLRLLV